MAIKIRFDNEDNIIDPTIVLMSRSAVKYGSLQYNGLKAKINFNSYSELSFNVDKALCSEDLWGKLADFKLIWVKDWNACFEINVDINEDNGISKTITAKSLGESELAQVNLYNIEVNTEDDIERSDYVPTILYNEENHKASLIHRLLEKCPHYRIGHIDSSIAGAQRTFQFNNQSIIDAFDTISKEIDCVFIINCSINAEGDLVRTINIYDLEFSCVDCGHRWEHIADTCPSCNGTNINTGYGEDTHIFISSKNLAQQINYTTSTGSVKNCFKLQAGDDLMTSAVINCNPNGGQYLWYISDEVKEDMSDELSQKIDEYEDLCEYYQNEYQVDISSDDVNNYNRIIQKYSIYSQDHERISLPIVGYSDLVKTLYNVLDFDIYLSNELMPTPQMINTTAEEQVAKLTTQSLSPVSVTDLSNLSLATANNVVLGMARVIVDNRYKITIVSSTLSNNTWQGSFCVTNYSNDDDTSTSGNINITINDDYENFLKQKIDKALQKSMTTNETIDIVGLFKLDISDFTNEIKKYSLSILKSFYDNCQTCLDVLIEQGIANGETWGDKNPNLYIELYIPYRNKLTAIESEIALRESEVKVVKNIEDYLYDIKGDVQASLNLQAFLGDTLWEQFSAYRREDTYQNDNYISDGLGNSEMFEKAKAFIAEAQKNIYKSANLQHSISSTLKNLLMLREFQSLKDYFEEGNWLRIETDGEINRLRLMSYEVDYENTNDLSVEFSDVSKLKDGISDIQSVLDNSKSIASSFNAVTRQAKNGNDSQKTIDKWINSGIALNNIKIIQDAENQNVIFDNNGILCREYLPMTNSYDDRQLKIINKGLFLTDDNWQSAKVGIGEIEYNGEKSYGVNAQLLIGDIIIGNELHIKDSQGQDILTVIDGRISTEVSEVKSAAASGTFEYYDPSNLSWTEQGNVDYFGYGLSQDETETDTGVKAAGNNNKYFLNKHNGNLYKSNGTKWVFQKTLSPRFDNYSTIAYTDNKAGTAESNAIANATNQVSTAKATIASSTLKYDETGITVNYYGYGAPTEIAGATQDKIYLDQNDGYYYTKGSGSNWTKSSNALPLYADQKANTAKSEAISAASADATQKANQAEENAIADATNQVNNATTTIANATNKYDTTGLTITYFGYGVPDIATATSGQKYLDQNDGYVYTKKSGSGWTKSSTALKLVTTKVAEDASADASSKANTAESNAIANATNQVNNATTTIANAVSKYDTTGLTISYYGYGTPDISTATSGQKYLDQNTGFVYTKNSGSGWTKSTSALTLITTKVATDAANDATTKANNAISTAATDATTKANTAENNAKTAAANAMSKYDEGSLTINYYGFGVPTTVAGSSQGEIYLDQNTGYYYTKGSGSTWTKSTNALPLYADQKATEAYNNALSYVGTYYITSEDASTTINQTKQEIEMTAAKAVSKYAIPDDMAIDFFGYGTPIAQGVVATAANQKYLDQEKGRVYTSLSDKSWYMDGWLSLSLITDRLDSKIDVTANNITQTVSQTYSTKNETATAANNAKNAAINDTTTRLENYYTKTQADTIIDQTAEQISLEANARLEATVGYSSKNWLNLNKYTHSSGVSNVVIDEATGSLSFTGTGTNRTVSFTAADLGVEMYGKTYTVSCVNNLASTTSGRLAVRKVSTNQIVKSVSFSTTGNKSITFTPDVETFPNGWYISVLATGSTSTTGNIDISQLMLRDNSISDDTFEPFANVQSVTTNLQSQITQNANQIQLKVSAGDVCSVISQSSDTITLSSGRLIINSGNFQLDSNGNATLAGGVIRSANYVADTSGTEIDLSNGVIDSKNFKLDSNGRMTASAGSFGGWEIGTEWVDAWSTPYESWGYWDHYIKSTNNQYGTIKLHSVGSGEIPSGMESVFITAFDITDTEGKLFFKVTMDGSISTWASLFAHEAHLSQVSLGAIGYTEKEHLELRTGDLDGLSGNPPSYIKFYDVSQNERLSLFTGRIRLSGYDTNRKIITQSRIDSTEVSVVQNNSNETEKYKSTLTPIYLNFIDNTYQSALGIKFNDVFVFYWNNSAIQCGRSDVPLKLLGSAITANGSPVAVSSDERVKRDIEDLDDRYLSIIKNVKPKKFKYDDSIALSGRTHTGYIAQELKQAIEEANLTTKELAAFVDLNGDGSEYAIRYDELIPLLHTWIKDIEERLSTIEKERK